MPPDAGGTPATGPQPAQIQTHKPFIGFKPSDVPPSQYVFLQDNDWIIINLLSNKAGTQVQVTYRYLNTLGEIKEGQIQCPILVAGITTQFHFQIGEGWLLSIGAQQTAFVANGQWTYTQFILVRSSALSAYAQGIVWEGYVPLNTPNGWPGTPAKEMADGAGTLISVTGSTPAAGADILETVPAGVRRNLYFFSAFLTTSATVANRTPQFIIDDGVNILYVSVGITAQAASLADRYSFTTVVPSQAFIGSPQPIGIQVPFPLKAGYRVRSLTTNIQAADQWSAPQYLVQEWGTLDA